MAKGDAVDLIATKIVLEAKDAIAELQNFNKEVQDSGKKLKSLQNIIAAVSQKMGGNLAGATKVVEKFVASFSNINPQVLKALGKELQTVENLSRKSLGAIGAESTESSVRINSLSTAIQQMAIKGKMSVDSVVRSLQTLNEYGGRSTQIGKLGFSGADIGRAGELAAVSLRKVEDQAKKAGDAGDRAGKKIKSAFEQVVSPVNVARIAIGTFVSMLLFQATQAITTFFKEASDQAKQMEETMYRLANAERILSESGQDITLKGLEDGITRIQKLLPIFAREDIAQMVGQIAIGTQQLGYSEKQIIDLAQAVAILNVQSVKNEDLMTTAGHVMTAVLGKSSTGISQLGISFNETEKQAAALTLGLLENGRTLQDLTDDELAAVKRQILMKNANVDNAESMELLNDFLDSNSAKIQTNAAAWKDLQTTVGQFINNVIPNFVPFLETLQKSFEVKGVQNLFTQSLEGFEKFSLTNAAIIYKLSTGIALTQKEYDKLKETLSELSDDEILKIFPDPSAIKDRFTRELVQSLVDIKDTATGLPDPLIEVDEEALKILEEIDDKIRDIAIDAQHAKEDLAIALSQKQEDLGIEFDQKKQDIDLEYERKEEDAARDLARKIEDINRDAARDKEKVLEKARQEEQKAEEDHQLKLWELKMRYLMDLEDALHARDARQIIRLQRQYELDKELLEKKKQQEDEERANSLESDLEDAELKRQERLEDAQIEYEQKLQDLAEAKARELEELNVWKAREEADLKLWYERELQEIDRNTRQKIEKLLAGYIEEQKIHEEQQEAIHQILLKYFGKNMDLVNSLVASTAAAFQSMAGFAQQAFTYTQPFYDVPQLTQEGLNQYHASERGFRHGGTLIATKPTTATFGEVPEAVTFTPLGRRGRDVGKIFSSGDGSGGEGRIALDITLSPDLRAQIVEDSMDGVAEVVARVNNSKV